MKNKFISCILLICGIILIAIPLTSCSDEMFEYIEV